MSIIWFSDDGTLFCNTRKNRHLLGYPAVRDVMTVQMMSRSAAFPRVRGLVVVWESEISWCQSRERFELRPD